MADGVTEVALSNLLSETRRFPPSPEFAAQANAGAEIYAEAAADLVPTGQE